MRNEDKKKGITVFIRVQVGEYGFNVAVGQEKRKLIREQLYRYVIERHMLILFAYGISAGLDGLEP